MNTFYGKLIAIWQQKNQGYNSINSQKEDNQL